MKNVVNYAISKVLFIALFVYTLGEMYVNLLKIEEFDRAWREGRIIDVDVEIPIVPAVLTILTGIIMIFLSLKRYKKFKLSLEEFEENDEREVLINSKAVKGAYTSIVYIAMVAIFILFVSASWINELPQLPIYLMGSVVIISTIIHAAIWCIEFKK